MGAAMVFLTIALETVNPLGYHAARHINVL
jgi:hypothetical protein